MNNMGNPVGKCLGFTAARASQNQQWPIKCHHCSLLLWI